MYAILECHGEDINLTAYHDIRKCGTDLANKARDAEENDCGELNFYDGGTLAVVTDTKSMFDHVFRMLPCEQLLDTIADGEPITVDLLLAKTALALTLDRKLDVIAEPIFDKMSEDDWQAALNILSVYLNMSVCDILAAIADRRPAPPTPDVPYCTDDNANPDDEMLEELADEYCDMLDNYDYPQPYDDDYYLSDEYQNTVPDGYHD